MGKNNTHNKMHTRYRNSYHIYHISKRVQTYHNDVF